MSRLSVRVWSLLAAMSLVVALLGQVALTQGAQDTATPPPAPSVMDAALPGDSLPGEPEVQLVQVATGLADPVNVASANDGSGRLFIVERTGTIRIVQDGQLIEEPFLDVENLVKTDFLEQGLLGLAFHPGYATNGQFYVYWSDYSANGAVTLAAYTVSADDPNVADPQSIRILFQYADPYINHNGGTIKFGPDGYLYVAIGDGGSAGDPFDNAQDLSNPFGKILRIDVDNGDPYAIPEDNPFAQAGQILPNATRGEPGRYHPDAMPEIWAYGLRNPWQFSFDRQTGEMYIADVGQNYWEEVNVAEAGVGGQNYGWDLLEGTHCYPGDVTECIPFGVAPAAEYPHEGDACSITGVGVFYGETASSLDGVYLNSDYCSGDIWGLVRDDSGAWQYALILETDLLVSGAGDGENGELYLTSCTCLYSRDYDPRDEPNGVVWQVVPADQVPEGATVVPTVEATEAVEQEATPGTAGEGTPEATPAA
ncbi:MAG TPA: PQQ-dependent sugar dehydrogenase [Thermomicrobiales bacterium]|jgi:glucose/arabinose dehydrogenase|nr:PQQ-dependent sugar dehydrogenase [Thermomicrobiales bacterium]